MAVQALGLMSPSRPATSGGGGAAGLGGPVAEASPADPVLVEDLKDVFEGAERAQALDELARLLEERPEDEAALARFQALMKELATEPDAEPADEDQGELALLTDDPEEVFGRFADAVPRRRRRPRPASATPSGGSGTAPRRRCASSPTSR